MKASAGGAVDGPWALPEGWRWERLGNVLPLSYGKALISNERHGGGSVPVYSSAGITGRHNIALCSEPSVIVGRKGAAGSVHFADGPSFAIDTAYFCSATDAKLDLRLGYYLLKYANLRQFDQSTAVPSLGRDIYNAVVVPVPPSMIQAALAKRIDELFADLCDGETALARARADLETWRKSLLKAAVTGELTADWRAANPPTETGADLLARIIAKRLNKAQLNASAAGLAASQSLPSVWASAKIGTIFDVFIGATPSRADKALWIGDVPWVSSGEVGFCRILSTRESISRKALGVSDKRIHPPGTVMLGMIGEGKTRGQAAILGIWAAHNQNCASIRVTETPVLPEFVFAFLRERYEVTRTGSSGGNQPALNKAKIEGFVMPLPPVAEQLEIARQIQIAEDAWDGTVLDADLGGALRQSILAAAFRGDLVT